VILISGNSEFHELCETCETRFGFEVHDAEPIVRGWLNRKWKLTTSHGEFLLKSYHPDRFRLYDETALVRALRWQSEMHQQIRHGEAEHLVGDGDNRMTGGWTNSSLTDNGREQARETAQRLGSLIQSRRVGFYSSDLKRCRQTAEIIR